MAHEEKPLPPPGVDYREGYDLIEWEQRMRKIIAIEDWGKYRRKGWFLVKSLGKDIIIEKMGTVAEIEKFRGG